MVVERNRSMEKLKGTFLILLRHFSLFFVASKESFKLLIGKISQRRRVRNDSLLTDIRNGTKQEGIVAVQRIRGQSKLHFDLCVRAGSKTGFPRPIKGIFEAQPTDFTDP